MVIFVVMFMVGFVTNFIGLDQLAGNKATLPEWLFKAWITAMVVAPIAITAVMVVKIQDTVPGTVGQRLRFIAHHPTFKLGYALPDTSFRSFVLYGVCCLGLASLVAVVLIARAWSNHVFRRQQAAQQVSTTAPTSKPAKPSAMARLRQKVLTDNPALAVKAEQEALRDTLKDLPEGEGTAPAPARKRL